MFYVLRDMGESVYVYDEDDGTMELLDKDTVIEAMEDTEIIGMDEDGIVNPQIHPINMEDCKFIADDDTSIFEHVRHVEQLDPIDEARVWLLDCGEWGIYKVKETYGNMILFTSNILVHRTDELDAILEGE